MKDQQLVEGIRVAKVIAQSGLCSRREAEQFILDGRVCVNGKVIDTPAVFITDHSIKVDGKLINAKQDTRLWLFYKPVGTITATKDPKNRKTIFNLLPKNFPRVISVGRLDFNTEGLLILTTNGALASHLEMPKNKWVRKYRARVFGKIDHERLESLAKGITIEGIHYGSVKVTVDVEKESNSWLSIALEEGKNREIRNIMEHLGLQVNRLNITSFGPFLLGNMQIGELREINKKQLESFIPNEIL
jgi:23S rRNA pseudouridine2605 synthase